jgi:hypothetical protein
MGIRIHRVLGYGITNLKKNDPRVDLKGYHDRYDEMHDKAALVAWLEANPERNNAISMLADGYEDNYASKFMTSQMNRMKSKDVRWLTHCGEGGNPKVLVLTPPSQESWFRYDDTLDYYDFGCGEDMRPRVKKLTKSTGIYPWVGSVRQVRPAKDPEVQAHLERECRKRHKGTPIPDTTIVIEPPSVPRPEQGALRMPGGTYNQLVGRWSKNLAPMASGALLKHLKADWKPTLPFDLVATMEWSGCFPTMHEPEGILCDLEPMIYTYWS